MITKHLIMGRKVSGKVTTVEIRVFRFNLLYIIRCAYLRARQPNFSSNRHIGVLYFVITKPFRFWLVILRIQSWFSVNPKWNFDLIFSWSLASLVCGVSLFIIPVLIQLCLIAAEFSQTNLIWLWKFKIKMLTLLIFR